MAYTTAAAFKAFRNISGAGDDAMIAVLITAVQAAIDIYCGRTFEGSAANRSFDAARDVEGATLWVQNEGDLASITTVTNGDATTIASSNYVTEPRNAVANGQPIIGITIKGSADVSWVADDDGNPENAITINGVWAYSATAPANIVQAANLWVAYLYDRRLSDEGDLVIVPGSSVTISRGMPAVVQMLLNPYRKAY